MEMERHFVKTDIEKSLANGDPNAELHLIPYGPDHPLYPDAEVAEGSLLVPGMLSLCNLVSVAPERSLVELEVRMRNMIWCHPNDGVRVEYELEPLDEAEAAYKGIIRTAGSEETGIEVSKVRFAGEPDEGTISAEPVDRDLPLEVRSGTVHPEPMTITDAMRDDLCSSIGWERERFEARHGRAVTPIEVAWLTPNVIVYMLMKTLPLCFQEEALEGFRAQRIFVGLGLEGSLENRVDLGSPITFHLQYRQRVRRGALQRTAHFAWDAFDDGGDRIAAGTARGMERWVRPD